MNARKILVVDDDKDIRGVVKMFLENAGYVVTTAADGVDAFNIIGKEQPDVMITDINMPRMDGIVLSLNIREWGLKIPIVIMSTNLASGTLRESLMILTPFLLEKPFLPATLLEVVKQALNSTQGQPVQSAG
ncbi:MAG: response regulator [Candidatus Taylorbacteria bacterium]|nr:response regulator [Candidatus Taylorbacteria bacterium]